MKGKIKLKKDLKNIRSLHRSNLTSKTDLSGVFKNYEG